MQWRERQAARRREVLGSLTDAEFLLVRDFNRVLMASDSEAVAFRIEVRAEHRRLARRRLACLYAAHARRIAASAVLA